MADKVLVILVEDEALIRMLLEEALAEAGFEVIAVANGQQAIAQLEATEMPFGALLTDIRLGRGLSGWDIARRARELAANLPVLYISGDSAHEWPSKGVPNSAMVKKPFHTAQIITTLSTLLSGPDSQ